MGIRKKHISCAVLGDGQTEQYYLSHLRDIRGFNFRIRPRLFKSITIEEANKLIKELIAEGFDMVIYFTDYDTIVKQGKIEKYKKIVGKYEKRTDVMICESMPSIEFWFLLHFFKTTYNFQNADEAIRELKKNIPDFSKEANFLEKRKWVEELCANGKLSNALKRASEIMTEKTKGNTGAYFPYTKIGDGIGWLEMNKYG
jgi:hypothetical protein